MLFQPSSEHRPSQENPRLCPRQLFIDTGGCPDSFVGSKPLQTSFRVSLLATSIFNDNFGHGDYGRRAIWCGRVDAWSIVLGNSISKLLRSSHILRDLEWLKATFKLLDFEPLFKEHHPIGLPSSGSESTSYSR